MVTQHEPDWVLLNYRIPREPSTPRITVWRKLKDLGVAQLGDGLVALPHDARTKEHLEWIAERVREADGEATLWVARPASRRQGADLADQLRQARDREFDELRAEIEAEASPTIRSVKRWRRQWQRISRRDYFRAPQRDAARLAIATAAEQAGLSTGARR
ncbi:MAG: Chromate resistance protein ChrB [Actinomycetota bacterium]